MDYPFENKTDLLVFLREKANQVRSLESKAEQALNHEQDKQKYVSYLRDKALLLADLPKETHSYLSACPAKIKTKVMAKLENIAQRAEQALELKSSFYMRHLLYPENYIDGHANELEIFIQEISKPGGKDPSS